MHTASCSSQRRHPRYTVHACVTLTGIDRATLSTVNLEGYTLDISRGGLSAHLPKLLRPGTQVVTLITQRGVHLIQTGEVRNVSYEEGLGHLVGIQFSQELQGAELRRLLDAVSGGRRLRELMSEQRTRAHIVEAEPVARTFGLPSPN
ncbi:MAG: hypothetical protein Tsb0013_00630 [Phycisphaerales bacterium]